MKINFKNLILVFIFFFSNHNIAYGEKYLEVKKLYDLYSFKAIPRMGKVIAGDKDSYQYLVESIRKFPNQEEFLKLLQAAGFENAKYRNLSLGIAALHSGWKI